VDNLLGSKTRLPVIDQPLLEILLTEIQ